MKVNNKPVKTKDIPLTSDINEIVLAKLSIKQAIMVAVVGLISTVAVTVIANLDKIRNSKNLVSEETGYYEGRASIVENAFRETEKEIQSKSELAELMGEPETANHLKDLADRVRRRHVKFQELHSKHIEAIQNGKRLSASKIKTETNEAIREVDRDLLEESNILLPTEEETQRFARRRVKIRPFKCGSNISTFRPIPLYGKLSVNIQGELAKIRTPIK